MKKIMRWTILFVTVFLLWDGVLFFYWRSTQAANTLNGSDIINTAFICPFLVFATITVFVFLVRWYKKRDKNASADNNALNNQKSKQSIETDCHWLQVYQVALQTHLGDQSATLIEQIQTFVPPNTDVELHRKTGAVLSRRISDLPIPIFETQSLANDAIRVQAIIYQLLATLDETLSVVAEKMKYGESMRSAVQENQQAILLHPAWMGESYLEDDVRTVDVDTPKSSWAHLSLRILVLLPAKLNEEDQRSIQHYINLHFEPYQISPNRFFIMYQTVVNSDECALILNQQYQALAENLNPELFLVMGAGSTLTQEWLDQSDATFIPAEAGFSLLMANEITTLPELPILARVTPPIWSTCQNSAQMLGKTNADQLNAIINDLSSRYKLPIDQIVHQDGLMISDLGPEASRAHQEELVTIIGSMELTAEKIVYAGLILERTTTFASGVALTLAIQQTKQSGVNTPVISSQSDTIRTMWLVAPPLDVNLESL
jgi:hypothetical protein